MTRASGQSMVEFSAGVAVLGMLTLGTISVAGLQEVQRRGIIAAREAAHQGEWVRGRSGTASLREPMRSMRPKRWMMRTGFQWMS